MFDSLSSKLQGAFKNLRGLGKISEDNISEALREVRMALLEADVNFKVAKEFLARVKEKSLGDEVLASVQPGQQIVKIIHDELVTFAWRYQRQARDRRQSYVHYDGWLAWCG
jgi:signal recognition particle subunit SRP54